MSRPSAFAHGLVVGKFYPPHLGHVYLIRTAAQCCQRVTVAVLASSVESIPAQTRVDWLRACFADHAHVRVISELDDVPIDYDNSDVWTAHVDIMRQALRKADTEYGDTPVCVDAVFTSEKYGKELARRFDAVNVCLDQTRNLYPVSGTAVRTNVPTCWDMLPASVRAGLALRVVVLGAESTGTTTLARDLTAALKKRESVWARTECVAEYGREYSANLLAVARAHDRDCLPSDLDWSEDDFIHVARAQMQLEESAAMSGGPVLICDTDARATTVWHERYRGQRSAAVETLADTMPQRSLYILTDHAGVPFEDDGLRDGEHLRPWMTERFKQVLDAQSIPWLTASGTAEQRVALALDAIDKLLAASWHFELPLEQRNFS